MITDLIKLIAAGETINLKLDALRDGRVRITLVPKLGDAPANATPEQVKLRELLASPLTLIDLPATLDGNLLNLINGASTVFADARQQVAGQVQGLQKALAELKTVAPAKPGKAKPHQKPPRVTAADKDGLQPKQHDGRDEEEEEEEENESAESGSSEEASS